MPSAQNYNGPKLDGPRLAPKSGAAKNLVVLLHGYGADGNDLIDLGRSWQTLLPDTAFVSPNAPEPCAMSSFGRQWFALTMRNTEERWIGVNKAQPALDAFLDTELEALGLDDSKLALVGFSQGTMMALHSGLRRRHPPACIVGYSGLLVLQNDSLDSLQRQMTGKPPVLLIHGDQDQVIPVQALAMAREALAASGVPVEWHVSRGVGHGIDGEGLRQAGRFLAERLK